MPERTLVRAWTAVLICAPAGLVNAQVPSRAVPIAIAHVTVLDVRSGARLPDHTVVIAGNRIVRVAPSDSVHIAPAATLVDGHGRFLIPGLVDTHVHAPWDAGGTPDTLSIFRWLLANGVTSMREASGAGREQALVVLRDRAERGEVLMPRLYVSGTASVPNVARYGARDLRDLVHRLAALHVDGIKVIYLTRDEALAAVDEARRTGLPVYGHTHVVGGVQRRDLPFGFTGYAMDVVRGGLSGVMHVTSASPTPAWRQTPAPADASAAERAAHFDAWWTDVLDGWTARSPADERMLIDTMLAHGTWLEPTLVTEDIFANPHRYRRHRGEAQVGMSVAEWWGVRDDTTHLRRRQQVMKRLEAFVRQFHDAGGLVLAGTDMAPLPGFGLPDELALLVEAGLSPLDALRAATLNPARAFGRARELGTVERGKLADVVLLDGDPLADIRNVQSVRAVVTNGRLLDRAALDALLADPRTAEVPRPPSTP